MKKFILLLLSFTVISCVNDSPIGNETNSSLATIKVDEYRDNVLFYSKMIHFSSDQLTNVTYSGNGTENNYENYSYNSKGLLSKVVRHEYPENFYTITTFSYDSEERIIEINQQRDLPSSETNSLDDKFTFTYLSDKIIYSVYYKNNFMNSREISLNTNQELKRYIIEPNTHFNEYNYNAGNIISVTAFQPNITANIATFSYSSLENEYDYTKFLYGEKWKLNTYLIGFITGQTDIQYILSKNLISEYHTIFVPSDPSVLSNKIKFDYVINDKNLIEKKTITNVRSSKNAGILTVRTEYLYTYK